MIREEAGLGKVDGEEDFVFHGARHSWASKGISAGESLSSVGAALGHANAQTTHAYAKIDTAAAQKVSDAVGGVLAASLARARKGQGGLGK
jgi:integrase